MSPYDAFNNYMNVLSDFIGRIKAQYPDTVDNEELNALLTTIHNQDMEIKRLEQELKKAIGTNEELLVEKLSRKKADKI
jgi:alpha-amylase